MFICYFLCSLASPKGHIPLATSDWPPSVGIFFGNPEPVFGFSACKVTKKMRKHCHLHDFFTLY